MGTTFHCILAWQNARWELLHCRKQHYTFARSATPISNRKIRCNLQKLYWNTVLCTEIFNIWLNFDSNNKYMIVVEVKPLISNKYYEQFKSTYSFGITQETKTCKNTQICAHVMPNIRTDKSRWVTWLIYRTNMAAGGRRHFRRQLCQRNCLNCDSNFTFFFSLIT